MSLTMTETSAQASTSKQAPPLAKHLASNEKHIRDKAVEGLRRFFSCGLPETDELEDGDWDGEWAVDKRFEDKAMRKLWQGLFYCYWMSDKPLVQQDLAQTLARFLLQIRSPSAPKDRVKASRCALAYLKAFWVTMGAEWTGIDKHRLDKYYVLLRHFLRQSFILLRREKWEPRLVEEFSDILTGPGGPLSTVRDPKIPSSLCHYIATNYVSELQTSLSSTEPLQCRVSSINTISLTHLLTIWLDTISNSPHKKFYSHIWDTIYQPLLQALIPRPEPPTKKRKRNSEEQGDDQPWKVLLEHCTSERSAEEIGKEILKKFWVKASEDGVSQTTRKWMYDSWREWDDE